MEPIDYSRRIVIRLIDMVLGAAELLLALRVLLKLLGANPGTGFVAWLYSVTDQLLGPFTGMFPTLALTGNYVVEFSTLFAMLAYAFVGWLVIRIVWFLVDYVLRLELRTQAGGPPF